MSVYTLQRGLVFRNGDREYTVNRLPDLKTVQIECVATGAYQTLTVETFNKKVLSGEFQICRDLSTERVDSSVPTKSLESQLTFSPASLSERHLATLTRRASYVRALRKRGISRGSRRAIKHAIAEIAKQIGDPKPPSPSSAMGWMRDFERSGNNVASLVTKNARRRRSKRLKESVLSSTKEALQKYYFTRGGSSFRTAHEQTLRLLRAKAEKDLISPLEATVSLSTVRRLALDVSPFDRDRIRLGVTYATAKWRHATGGSYATRPLERVEMDHTQLDLWVICDRWGIPLGRPTLTVMVDSYSHYIIGLYISFEGESLSRVVKTMKMAIAPKTDITAPLKLNNKWHAMGLWETLVVDNGLAFHSPQFRLICAELNSDIEYCPVRQPWFKPNVERYLGSACAQLPFPGRPGKPGVHAEPARPERSACIMFSDLCEGLIRWAVDTYPLEFSSRKQTRPIDLFCEGLDRIPPPSFADGFSNLDLLAGLSAIRTVNQEGIIFESIQYTSEQLAMLRRNYKPTFKTEIKFDPNDLGTIYVKDPMTSRWLSVPARHAEYAVGLSLTQHRQIRKATRDIFRQGDGIEQLLKSRLELQDHWDNAIARGKRKIRKAKDYAIFCNLSSAALTKSPAAKIAPAPEQVITPTEAMPEDVSIPSFASFNLDTL